MLNVIQGMRHQGLRQMKPAVKFGTESTPGQLLAKELRRFLDQNGFSRVAVEYIPTYGMGALLPGQPGGNPPAQPPEIVALVAPNLSDAEAVNMLMASRSDVRSIDTPAAPITERVVSELKEYLQEQGIQAIVSPRENKLILISDSKVPANRGFYNTHLKSPLMRLAGCEILNPNDPYNIEFSYKGHKLALAPMGQLTLGVYQKNNTNIAISVDPY